MIKQAKYLALFLLVVFTLPKVYQDIHILKHHTVHIPAKADRRNFLIISEPGAGTCPVCNFEFAISNFPVTFFTWYLLVFSLFFTLSRYQVKTRNF